MGLDEIIQQTKAYHCLDCGKCTSVCPVTRIQPQFSPRLVVKKALLGFESEASLIEDLWSCITCGRCENVCPSGVDFIRFIQLGRIEAFNLGKRVPYSHHRILQIIMEIMSKNVSQKRTEWIPPESSVSEKGEYYYFTGCLPYFEVIFKDLGVPSLEIARNALKIFNRLGIAPVISNQEKCCGHDLIWTGDLERFKLLAEHNIKDIQAKGAKRVVVTCAEGYRTLKEDYPRYCGELGFEILHISELLEGKLEEGKLELNNLSEKVTFHDPCRLSMEKVFEQPRKVLRSIPGLSLSEMERNRYLSLCCGTNAWVNCTNCNKQIQLERLREAEATGATTLVTACPKCQIHFHCALHDDDAKDISIKIKDFTSLVSESIK
jgi:heterodisulfide reductase subunit D